MIKHILTILLSIFLVCAFSITRGAEGQNSGQDVLKELDDFQKSLANWMKNLDVLGAQFSELQKNVNNRLNPLADFEKSIKGADDKLNAIISRIENVEKAASTTEIRGMLDSFNKTFDVLKKLLSDLTKRVEDQEIKTTVLEKRVLDTQKPLEPVKKAIEDLGKVVTDKIGDQEKRIATVEDGIKARMAALDATIKTLDEQLKGVVGFDTRIKKLETIGSVVIGTVTAEAKRTAPTQTAAGTETAKATAGTGTIEVVKERIVTPEEEGFVGIGDGFYIRNVKLSLFGASSQIKGEIKNFSDKDRSITAFVIKVYNATNVVLFTQDFSIKTFKKNEVRNFDEIISGYTPSDIASYTVMPKGRY